jgi:hypothetical protein
MKHTRTQVGGSYRRTLRRNRMDEPRICYGNLGLQAYEPLTWTQPPTVPSALRKNLFGEGSWYGNSGKLLLPEMRSAILESLLLRQVWQQGWGLVRILQYEGVLFRRRTRAYLVAERIVKTRSALHVKTFSEDSSLLPKRELSIACF